MKPEILSVALVGNAFPRAADDGNAPECQATRNANLLASSYGANEELLRHRVMTSTCGLPLGAAWSGYGCKPAVRLTRSASLFLTQSRLRGSRHAVKNWRHAGRG